MNPQNNEKLFLLCRGLDYKFSNIELLRNALTHSSYCYEHKLKYGDNNERLEFLGDAVLDAVIGEELYRRLPDSEEGELSRLRASIVCEQSLIRKAEELDLLAFMWLGNGEKSTGGSRKHRSLVADAMEATLGAIYLDGGWQQVHRVVLRLFSDIVDDALAGKLQKDYKTALQEKLQEQGTVKIEYVIEGEEGPDHDKTFYAALLVDEGVIGRGSGRTKKAAEQNAAREALDSIVHS